MKIEYDKLGNKVIICDNWGEFFNYFKEWHAKEKKVGIIPSERINNEKEFDHYVGFEGEGFGDFWYWNEKTEGRGMPIPREIWMNNGEMHAIETELGTFHKVGTPVNEPTALVLNLSADGSKIRYNDWKEQEEKAGKVLREIWTTGVAKSTHGLDLNWPKASQTKQPPKEENVPIKNKKQSENYENWTKEQLITEIKKLKSEIEELKNDKVLSICSKQVELKKKQDRLEKLEKSFDSKKTLDNSTNKDNGLSLSAKIAIGSGVAVVLVVLAGIIWRIEQKKKKNKEICLNLKRAN